MPYWFYRLPQPVQISAGVAALCTAFGLVHLLPSAASALDGKLPLEAFIDGVAQILGAGVGLFALMLLAVAAEKLMGFFAKRDGGG